MAQKISSQLNTSLNILLIPGSRSTIRDFLVESQDRAVTGTAHFYFDYKDTMNQNAERVFSSILKQLAGQQPRLHSKVEEKFWPTLNVMATSLDQILSAIISVSQDFKHVYLLLDALDECEYETQDYVISYLSRISKDCQSFRCFITSRPHLTQMKTRLQDSIEFGLSANEADIELLVRSRLGKNRDISSDFVEEVLKKLSSSANGMYVLYTLRTQWLSQTRL